jgi:hypothetical protein
VIKEDEYHWLNLKEKERKLRLNLLTIIFKAASFKTSKFIHNNCKSNINTIASAEEGGGREANPGHEIIYNSLSPC